MTTTKKFEAFIKEYRGVVAKVCNLYTNNENDFRDHFQEVVLQLWRSFETFRGDSKASTWVYRVALNVCLSQLRKEERRIQTSKLEGVQPKADTDQSLEEKEQKNIMYDAIKQLDEIDRAIILLYLEEKSYKETADIMGLSVSHIGVKINRIKIKLKEIINEKY